jgi:hypothetical protein
MPEVTVNIAELNAEFGAYYKKGTQSVKDIRHKILVMNETDELFVKQITNDTRLEGGTAEIDPVLQAYQDAFTPKGDLSFGARVIELFPLKIDWEKNPTGIWKSWLGFLASESLDRKEWPFMRYVIDKLIIPKATEDWEITAVFNGVVSAITSGIAKMVSGGVNGIKYLINKSITAGDTIPFALGTVPTDPVLFVGYVERFCAQLPKEVIPFLQTLAMSQTLHKRFKEGMRLKYNMNYKMADLTTVIDTTIIVKGYRSHEGSNKMWTTIRGNAVMGVKHSGNESVFQMETSKRTVSLFTDFWKGMGFWQGEYLYTNDQDLT